MLGRGAQCYLTHDLLTAGMRALGVKGVVFTVSGRGSPLRLTLEPAGMVWKMGGAQT